MVRKIPKNRNATSLIGPNAKWFSSCTTRGVSQ